MGLYNGKGLAPYYIDGKRIKRDVWYPMDKIGRRYARSIVYRLWYHHTGDYYLPRIYYIPQTLLAPFAPRTVKGYSTLYGNIYDKVYNMVWLPW